MSLTLWIDENTFATHLMEKVFKKQGMDLYTINKGTDFAYLICDLRPSLLVIDSKTALNSADKFRHEFMSDPMISSLPVIMIDGKVDFIGNVIAEIKRPFDPFKITEMIKNLQSGH